MIQLQRDAILCKAPKELVSWDLQRTVVPASELTSHIEELSQTLVLILTYSSNVLENIVSPEARVFYGFDVCKVRKLLTQFTIGNPPVSILVKDREQTLEFLRS